MLTNDDIKNAYINEEPEEEVNLDWENEVDLEIPDLSKYKADDIAKNYGIFSRKALVIGLQVTVKRKQKQADDLREEIAIYNELLNKINILSDSQIENIIPAFKEIASIGDALSIAGYSYTSWSDIVDLIKKLKN